MGMIISSVSVLEKGICIEMICDHGGYSYVINDGEPTWFKFDGNKGGAWSYTGLHPKKDAKLITKLNREWKGVRFYG